MRALYQLPVAVFITSCAVFAQAPAPAAVFNPASNIPAGLPNSGIAQGSIFVVYGKNLGPVALTQAQSLPLPTTGVGTTTVQIAVGGVTVPAPMIYSSATQIAGVLPSNVPVGTGTLTVSFGGLTGSVPIQVVASNFGISTVNQTGGGPAVVTFADYKVVTTTNSAKPGDTLLLWGTGLGPITGGDAGIPAQVPLSAPVKVYVGGAVATVTYSGRSGAPGLDQINFVVPAGVSGCYVSLVVQTGNTVSNSTTFAVSPNGGVCSDANGIPLSSLSGALANKGALSIGSVVLTQTSVALSFGGQSVNTTTTTGLASFTRLTAAQLGSSASVFGVVSPGSCGVYNFTGTTPPNIGPVQALGLDAGPAITVAPPTGIPVSMTQATTGIAGNYGATLPSALTAGTYAISGKGGVDVGAFNTNLTVPQPLTWTNQAAITLTNPGNLTGTVKRTDPLTITWSGGDPNGFAEILGFSTSATTSSGLGGVFVCVAPIAPGQFTIPAPVLLALPPTPTPNGIALLFVGAATANQVFSAPGLDFAFAGSVSLAGSSVFYQ